MMLIIYVQFIILVPVFLMYCKLLAHTYFHVLM